MQTPPELWAVASPAVATASMIEVWKIKGEMKTMKTSSPNIRPRNTVPMRRDGKRRVRTKSKQTDIDRTSCKSHIQAPLRFVNQHSAKMKLSIILRSCDGGARTTRGRRGAAEGTSVCERCSW